MEHPCSVGSSMSARIQYAIMRFPEFAEAIKQYCADSRFFFNLCEDYGEAIEILRHWERFDEPSTSESVRMCRELVEDLEQEILLEMKYLNNER